MKRLGSQNGTRPGPNTAAFADDNNHLALAVLVASKAAVDTIFLEVGGLHVTAKVPAKIDWEKFQQFNSRQLGHHYLYGRFEYFDVFGEGRISEFCYQAVRFEQGGAFRV